MSWGPCLTRCYVAGLFVVGTDNATITVPSGPAVLCSAVGVTITGLSLIVSKEGQSAVTVPREGELKLVSCKVSNRGGDGVQVFGKCKIEVCKVFECETYGVAVLSGGEASIEKSTIADNKKTGVLSRGNGSRVSLGAGSIIEKNKMHGVGADGGGSFTAVSTIVRGNTYVGVNLGDSGSGHLSECEIQGNNMHGLQVPYLSAGCSHSRERLSAGMQARKPFFVSDHLASMRFRALPNS